MALDSFVAGRYTWTFGGVDAGISDEGILLQQETRAELIQGSDAYGDSVLDLIYRGLDVFLQVTCKAFKPGSLTPFYPWASLGVIQVLGGTSPIGRLGSAVSSAAVLTALSGTAFNTAGATIINTLTAPQAILAENFNGELLFNSKLRKVPIRMRCLPQDSGAPTTTRAFSTT